MSLYTLIPKLGFDRYTIQVGWSPHRTYVAALVDFTWDPVTEPDRQPDVIHLGPGGAPVGPPPGRLAPWGHPPQPPPPPPAARPHPLAPRPEVLSALEPYADIPAGLPARLRADQAKHPVRR